MKSQEFRSAMIYLTNDCNLSCPYCFVKKDKRRMSYKTGRAVVDFMLEQIKSGEIFINFFGGEPLLEFQLIKKIVKYGKEQAKIHHKKIRFGVTTNGTLFTPEIINFFKKNNIGVLFSFEGDKKRMVKIKGERAYRRCVWAIRELKKKGFKVTARTTIEPNELRLVDFTKHIFSLGFDAISHVGVAEKKWEQKKTDKAFMELADYYISQARKGNILELNYFNRLLAIKYKAINLSLVPCGAGREMVGVTTDGKILPCHHPEAWEKDFVLGSVFNGKIDEKKRAPFLNCTREDFIGCDNCLAQPYCAGCCLVNSYLYADNMLQPLKGHCVWIKARVKAVEHIYNTLIEKEKNKHLLKKLNSFKKKKSPIKKIQNIAQLKNILNKSQIARVFAQQDLIRIKKAVEIMEKQMEETKKRQEDYKIWVTNSEKRQVKKAFNCLTRAVTNKPTSSILKDLVKKIIPLASDWNKNIVKEVSIGKIIFTLSDLLKSK